MAKTTKKPAKSASNGKAAAPKAKKISPSNKMRTRGEFYTTIADQTGLSRTQVKAVFEAVGGVLAADLSKSGSGVVNIAGMMKVTAVKKPATKETTKPNPFKPGEMMVVKAKPARTILKVRPLKSLKALV